MRVMPRAVWMLLMVGVAGCRTVEVQELSPGVKLYGSVSSLSGQMVFIVVRRCPSLDDADARSTQVLSYDFATRTITKLWDAPRGGRLIVSPDGKWLGLIMHGRERVGLPPTELVVYSVQTRETRTFEYPWNDDIAAVIVDDHLFVHVRRKQDLIENHDLRTGAVSKLGANEDIDAKYAEYALLKTSMTAPHTVFFKFSPSWRSPEAKGMAGFYAYDVTRGRSERMGKVGDADSIYERARTGEVVSWERQRYGSSLVARRMSGDKIVERELYYSWGDAYNFQQLSPCGQYALLRMNWISHGGRGMVSSDFVLCDIASGTHRIILRAHVLGESGTGSVGDLLWVQGQGPVASRAREKE